jgi:RimJ/RimL family protein N-acetyltransferase
MKNTVALKIFLILFIICSQGRGDGVLTGVWDVELDACLWGSSELGEPGSSPLPEDFDPLVETPRAIIGESKVTRNATAPESEVTRFQVALKERNQPIGMIQLVRHLDGSASLPLGFDPVTRGEGIGTEVKYAIIEHAFNALKVSSITDMIMPKNLASKALHEKLGFRKVSVENGVEIWKLSREDFVAIQERFTAEVNAGRDPYTPGRRCADAKYWQPINWRKFESLVERLTERLGARFDAVPEFKALKPHVQNPLAFRLGIDLYIRTATGDRSQINSNIADAMWYHDLYARKGVFRKALVDGNFTAFYYELKKRAEGKATSALEEEYQQRAKEFLRVLNDPANGLIERVDGKVPVKEQ